MSLQPFSSSYDVLVDFNKTKVKTRSLDRDRPVSENYGGKTGKKSRTSISFSKQGSVDLLSFRSSLSSLVIISIFCITPHILDKQSGCNYVLFFVFTLFSQAQLSFKYFIANYFFAKTDLCSCKCVFSFGGVRACVPFYYLFI